MSKPKAIISACLLGEYCRYDAQTKKVNQVIEAFKQYDIIPFCPEAPLFGTPRERIGVVRINGKNRIITEETSQDVTQLLQSEIDAFIQNNQDVDAIVLKSKSPSCGTGTTPILNQDKEILHYGDGIASSIFQERYKNTKIEDESAYV